MEDKMNLSSIKHFRKELRNNSTSAESVLWKLIKGRQIGNLKFRRQHSVGPYVLDFYCPEIKLAIELDGEYHVSESSLDYDENRTLYLYKELGISVLRFENRVVFENFELIVKAIEDFKNKTKV